MRNFKAYGNTVLAALTLGGMLTAQTKLDLRTQSKSVDFSGATSTRPMKTGTTLPATCSVGELFFDTDAVAGANVFGCAAPNTWVEESAGGSGGGLLTLKADGVTVGTRAAANVVSGQGILNALVDTGTQINVQHTADTAVLLTRSAAQAGGVTRCISGSGSATTYTCAMTPTATTYATGMVVQWVPDVSGSGGVTLNIDTLGAKAIKLADGVGDPTEADIVAGRLYALWYDGTRFRLQASSAVIGVNGASQPSCSAAVRGRLWFTFGATGVQDGLEVCAKDGMDAYAWRTVY